MIAVLSSVVYQFCEIKLYLIEVILHISENNWGDTKIIELLKTSGFWSDLVVCLCHFDIRHIIVIVQP
jgi:hypothetical protein